MDQGLKERLIGAAVLVALAVWLIPWLLNDSADAPSAAKPSLDLPVPARETAPPVKTEVIDLAASKSPPTPAGSDDAAAVAPARAGGDAAPPQTVVADRKAETPGARAGAEDTLGATAPAPAAGPKPAPASTPAHAAAATGGAAPSVSAPAPARPAPSHAAATTAAAKPSAAPATSSARHSAAPAPAAAGDWAVQLGSFGEAENAQRLVRRVATYGDKAAISKYRADGRVMYRVRMGPYTTRPRAEAAASALSAHGFVAQVVSAD